MGEALGAVVAPGWPVDGMSAGEAYAEQYTAWHLANSPGARRRTTLTRISWIEL